MLKRRTGLGSKALALLLAVLMVVPTGALLDISAYAAGNDTSNDSIENQEGVNSAESNGGIVLSLSTNEIIATIARVAGQQVVNELENRQEDSDQARENLAAVDVDTTQVVVDGTEVVTPLDQDDNEVVVEEDLPQVDTQSYYVDQAMADFVAGIQIPEDSKAMEQNLLDSLQGLWFVKSYSGSGYQAVAMLNPETLEIQVSFINSGSVQQAFSLKVVDNNGDVVAFTEVNSMIQKAATLTLTAEELAKYQAQGDVTIEVLNALAESQKNETPEVELGLSEDASLLNPAVAEDDAPSPSDGTEEATTPTEEDTKPNEEDAEKADTDDATTEEAGTEETAKVNLVSVEAVVVETQTVKASASNVQVPSGSVFTGLYGGITPFAINYTVEFYIDNLIYKGPETLGEGQLVADIGTPPQSEWPGTASAFKGWFEQGADTPYDFSTPLYKNLRLYAKFGDHFVITFKDLEGPKGSVVDTKLVTPNAQIFVTDKDVKRPLEPGETANDDIISHWYVEGDATKFPFMFGTAATQDLTLVPFYTNLRTVWFISEGSQNVKPQSVAKGTPATDPKLKPTGAEITERAGYTFLHWSTVKGSDAPENKFNFNTPITETTYLYAIWKAEQVNYKIVYWVDDPNVAGRYAFSYYQDGVKALSGSSVTLAEPDVRSYINHLTNDIKEGKDDLEHPLRFSEFSRADTITISGTGNSVSNVYYDRINYDYQFFFPAGSENKSYLTYPANGDKEVYSEGPNKDTHSFTAKYQQDVSTIWPEGFSNGYVQNGYVQKFYGWLPLDEVGGNSVFLSRRYFVTTDMLYPTLPRTDEHKTIVLDAYWTTASQPAKVEYWLEALDGNGEEPRLIQGTTRTYNNGGLGQTFDSAANLLGKELDGFEHKNDNINTKNPPENGGKKEFEPDAKKVDGYTVFKFYYPRNRKTIHLHYNDGNAAGAVPNVMFEEPLAKYYEDPSAKKPEYTFKGWYEDPEFIDAFDFDNAIMPKDDLMLYAKWEPSKYTVTYYDRLVRESEISTVKLLATQGYGDGDTANIPTGLTLGVDDEPIVVGQTVKGYGKFMGWQWQNSNMMVDLVDGMPIQNDLKVFAIWAPQGHTVTYKPGDGTGKPPTDTEVYDSGRNVSLKDSSSLTPPPGEVFYGWVEEGDSTKQLFYPRNLYEIRGNVTFIAEFGPKENTYNLKFDPGFAGSTEPSINWNVPMGGSVYLLDDVFTNLDADMVGWSETWGATTPTYGIDGMTLVAINKNTTLYAVWKYNTHNVYFQADPVKGQLFDNNAYTDKVVYENIPHGCIWDTVISGAPNVKARPGYYFTGWSPAIPAGTTAINADATYVAQFETQSAITLTAGSTSRPYNGIALTNPNIAKSGLSAAYKVEGTMTAASTITNFGFLDNTIDTYKIIRIADNVDVTAQFAVTTKTGTLNICKAPVTITANNKTKEFGQVDPVLDAVVAGRPIAGDEVKYTLSRNAGETVGTYPIKVTVGNNPNYIVTKTDATFTIKKSTTGMTAAVKNEGLTVVYDGNKHGIVVDVKINGAPATGYTIQYATTAGAWSATQPVKTDVSHTGNIHYKVTHPGYADVEGFAKVTITAAPVTVTANNKSKAFGAAEPTFDAAVTGKPVNGVAVNYTVARAAGETVGTYPITVTVGSNPNYTVTKKDGTFTITKAGTGMTASAKEKDVKVVYDGNKHGIVVDVKINSAPATGHTIEYSATAAGPWSATQPDKVNVADSGTIYFKVTHPSYNDITGSAKVTISKAPVKIVANNKTMVYGDAVPALDATVTGKPANGDNVNYTLDRDLEYDVGTYPIIVTVGSNPNYNVTKTDGTFTITKANQGMTARAEEESISIIYDGNAHGIVVEVLINNEPIGGHTILYSTSATGPWTATQPPIVNVADSGKIYFKVSHPNYNDVIGFGTVTITPATVYVKANDKSKVFGAVEPTFDAVVTGKPANGVAINYTVKREPGENVGNYTITVAESNNPNYYVDTDNGTFSITKSGDGMTADAKNKNVNVVYDGNAHGIVVDVKINGNAATGHTIQYSDSAAGPWSATQPAKVNVADSGQIHYKVTHPNYNDVTGFATVTISKAPVTVKANDKSKAFGAADPAIDATVGGKPAAGVAVNYTVARAAGENVGTHPITVTVGNNPNYTVTKTDGTLTITKSGDGMTANAKEDDVVVVYDGLKHGIEVDVKINGAPATGHTIEYREYTSSPWSTTQPSKINVQSSTIYYKVSHPNYNDITGSASVTIKPAPVTITANDKSKAFGALDPVFDATEAGKPANGDAIHYSVSRVAGEAVGSYKIMVILPVDSNNNYDLTTVDGTLTITKSGTGMTASAKEKDVKVVYDGDAHGIVVDVKINNVAATGHTIQYSASATGPWSANQPAKVNVADSGTIYYKVTHPSYNDIIGSATVTITKAPITVTANNKSKAVNGAEPTLDATVTGKPVNGNAILYTLARTPGEAAGTYPITVTVGTNPNYTVTAKNGTLSIQKATTGMTAEAANKNVVYDGNKHGIVVNVQFAIAGTSGQTIEYSTSAAGPWSTTQPSKVNVADTGNIFYKVTHPDYADVTGSATVTITKRNVTVTANNVEITYRDAIPSNWTATEVNKPANGAKINYTLNCTIPIGKLTGTFPITVSVGSNNPNYNVASTNGILTIKKLIIHITVTSTSKFQQAKEPVYGSTVGTGNKLDKGDNVKNIGLTYTREPGEVPGSYPIYAHLDHEKYEIVVKPGKLIIKPRTIN